MMNNDNFNKIKNKLSLNDYVSKQEENKALKVADNNSINTESKKIALDRSSSNRKTRFSVN